MVTRGPRIRATLAGASSSRAARTNIPNFNGNSVTRNVFTCPPAPRGYKGRNSANEQTAQPKRTLAGLRE